MEKSVPSVNFKQYLDAKGGTIEEEGVKVIKTTAILTRTTKSALYNVHFSLSLSSESPTQLSAGKTHGFYTRKQ